MKKSFFTVLSSLLLAHIALLPLFAQSDSTILGKDLDQVVITAQYAPTDIRQTVNSVKILTSRTIEQRLVLSLYELLQTEPNIRLSQDPILGSVISINALKGENLKILIDGVPVVGRLNGNIDAGQIPLNAIQKVEIIEGAQSLLYGSDASGGVINIITKKSQIAKFEGNISSQYENNGFRQLAAGTGYSSGKWIAQANANYLQFVPATDTSMGRDQLWNPKQQLSGKGIIRFLPNERTDLRVNVGFMKEQVDNPGDLKRPQFKPYAFDDYYFTNRKEIGFHGEKWTKHNRLIQATASWNTFSRIKNSYRHDFQSNTDELLTGLQDTASSTAVLGRLTVAHDVRNTNFGYIFGIENYYEQGTGTRLADTTLSETGMASTNDLGIFGSGKYKILSNLTAQTGARLTINNKYGTAITPSTWVHWQPKPALHIRFSWAYGFRSPAIKELYFSFIDVNHYVTGNPQLKPEKSLNLRSEISFDLIRNRNSELTATISGFYNRMSDRIVLTALGPVHYEYRNVDNFTTLGGTAGITYKYRNVFNFRSDIVNTGFNNINDEVDVSKGKILWSPEWVNDLTLTFFEGKLDLNIWHKWTGKTPFFYNDNGKTTEGFTESWSMLNSGISGRLWKNKLRINLGVKNIFNIRQLQVNNINGIHVEVSNQQALHWGRSLYAGMSVKF